MGREDMPVPNDLPQIIAKNIASLRRSAGMTQAGLAEKIGYSDKSVSKWERAEGIPDVICLKKIADVFDVTVDYMLNAEHADAETDAQEKTIVKTREPYKVSYATVSLLSVAGVWLLAFAVYIILKLCGVSFMLGFVIACPITAVLLIIFNALWGKGKLQFWCVSLLVWSILFLICYAAGRYHIWLLMCIGFPATVVVWLACRVRVKPDREDADSE